MTMGSREEDFQIVQISSGECIAKVFGTMACFQRYHLLYFQA